MNFNVHSPHKLANAHAILSPSNYHWVNYTEEKLDRVFFDKMAARRGTELHAFAAEAIRLGIRLPDTDQTLNKYVNDAIGFKMTPEVALYYSEECFGTADAVGFRRNTLRIHDLKTGVTPASMKQLVVYAALFCLEYRFKPSEIKIELRIYQNDEIVIAEGDVDEIFHVMDRITVFSNRISILRMEAP